VSRLWIAAVDGSTAPREVAAGTSTDWSPRWAADSATVFFLSDRAEGGAAQLHRVRLAVDVDGDGDVEESVETEFFHRALRRFGVEHEYVVYPREGNGIRERDHQLDLLRRTREWFDRWLTSTDTRSASVDDGTAATGENPSATEESTW
jgi:hypothetical protein